MAETCNSPSGDAGTAAAPAARRATFEQAGTTGCASAGSPRKRFTAEDRQRALAVVGQCGGNLTKASARLGLAVPLLSKWRSEAIRARLATRQSP